MKITCTPEYKRYMRSSAWRAKRDAVLARAGNICEFESDSGHHSHRCTQPAKFCTRLNWERVYNERLEDLQATCELHHLVVQVMTRVCKRCEEPVFNCASDAEVMVQNYRESCEKFDLVELHEEVPRLCDYCDHMLNKDD